MYILILPTLKMYPIGFYPTGVKTGSESIGCNHYDCFSFYHAG